MMALSSVWHEVQPRFSAFRYVMLNARSSEGTGCTVNPLRSV